MTTDTPTTDITEQIKDAITKALPAHVGDVLCERLRRLDMFEAQDYDSRIKELQEQLEATKNELDQANQHLLDWKTREDNLRMQAEANDKFNRDLNRRQDLIDLREEHANEKVGLMRGLVRDVFANSKYKYTVNGEQAVALPGMPAGDDEWGSRRSRIEPRATTVPVTTTVEGEA